MLNKIMKNIFLTLLVVSFVFNVSAEVVYESGAWDNIVSAGGKITLPREATVTNLVNKMDGKWYKKGVEGSVVASDTSTVANNIPPSGVTEGAALKVGYITGGAASLISYINPVVLVDGSPTNATWEAGYRYTLTVRHRIAHRDGSITPEATGTVSAKLQRVRMAQNELVTVGSAANATLSPDTWTTSVVEVAAADLVAALGQPLVININKPGVNDTDQFSWVDWVKLEKFNLYDEWTSAYELFSDAAASTNDFDGDGVNNAHEYAFGGNPTNASEFGLTGGFSGLLDVGGTNYIVYVYPRHKDEPRLNLSQTILTSTSLVVDEFKEFNSNEFYQTGVGIEPFGTNYVAVTNLINIDMEDVRFIGTSVQLLDN